jgi:hypothetical protein
LITGAFLDSLDSRYTMLTYVATKMEYKAWQGKQDRISSDKLNG